MDGEKLELAEPPLFYPAESEETDFFMDSTPDVKQGVTENSVSNPGAASTKATTLIGVWSGTNTHRRGQQIKDLTSFSITEEDADGSFKGSGIDKDGIFTVEGTIEGGKVDFTKFYTVTYSSLRYIGTLDMEEGTIVGQWGPPDMETSPTPSKGETEGHGDGETEEHGDGETEGHGNGDEGDDQVSQVGSAHSGVKTDAAEVLPDGGTFSLVRRPVDYLLYRPSDAELQESRPKALWQMARNAAKHWYRSRHLNLDVLRERRDQRNRYTELFSMREEFGIYYTSEECVNIIRQTHPNDRRLWGAIVHYKEHRRIKHVYV